MPSQLRLFVSFLRRFLPAALCGFTLSLQRFFVETTLARLCCGRYAALATLRSLRYGCYATLAKLRWPRCARFAMLATLRSLRYVRYAISAALHARNAAFATLRSLR